MTTTPPVPLPVTGVAASLSPTTRAILWMGLALVSFSAVAIAGREAGRVLPASELVFWRSLVGIAVIGGIYIRQGQRSEGPATTVLPQHMARALVHFAAQYAWLYALMLMPLAELFALEFTAPLWVAILAPLFLGERLTRWRIVAALLGFGGAVVVAEPGLLSGDNHLAASTGTLFAVASAVGFACSIILTKRLTRVDPALRILFWMQVLQAIIAAVVLGWGGLTRGNWPFVAGWTTSPAVWGLILAFGIAGLSAHYALTRAIGLVDAIIVAPMDFLRLPLIAIVGALFYGEVLRPNVALGAAVVIAANAINIVADRRARQHAKT